MSVCLKLRQRMDGSEGTTEQWNGSTLGLDNSTVELVNSTVAVLTANHQWQLMLLLVLVLATSGLAIAVVATIYHRVALHHQCYYIVASLALADLLRSLLIMPTALAQSILGTYTVNYTPFYLDHLLAVIHNPTCSNTPPYLQLYITLLAPSFY